MDTIETFKWVCFVILALFIMYAVIYDIYRIVTKIPQYAIVKFTDERVSELDKDAEVLKDKVFVFLGEIPDIPGHCIVVGYDSGKIFIVEHISYFRELNSEELDKLA